MSGIHHRLGRNKAAIAFLFLALGAPVWIARGGEIALEPSGKLGVAENDISRFGPPARTQEAQSSAGFSSEEPRPIGHGDGKIWVIPSLSAPSVKNGGKLTISAVVKAPAGVREVRAEIRDGDRILDTLKLKASSAQMGGVGNLGGGKLRSANDELRNEERGERETSVEAGRAPSTKKPDGQANVRNAELSSGNSSFAIRHSEFGGPLPAVGLWTADWTAHDLDEKSYSVILRITDAQGHIFEDTSLQFSDPTAGITTTGTTGYPNGGMNLVGKYVGNRQEYLRSAAIDPSAGFAYFGTYSSPGRVVKVALNGDGIPISVGELILNSGEDHPMSPVIDSSAGYAYFATDSSPGRVVKIALNGSDIPTRVGSLTLNAGEDFPASAIIDPSAGYAYFGTSNSPGRVVKVALNGSGIPTRVGTLTLNAQENYLGVAVIDISAGYAYFGTGTSPGRVVKVALNGSGIPIRVGTLTLNPSEDYLGRGVIDPYAGYAYFTNEGMMVKVALNGAGLPIRIGAITLPLFQEGVMAADIDPINGFAYLGTYNDRGPDLTVSCHVFKVALNGNGIPTLAYSLTLNPGENDLYTASVDPFGGYVYFGTYTSPASVVKVALNGVGAPTRVGTGVLDRDGPWGPAVIDPLTNCAYFVRNGLPSHVTKMLLKASGNPIKVGVLTFPPEEAGLSCPVIDPAAGYAYIGIDAEPGSVVKVALNGTDAPTRVGSLTLNPGEDRLATGVIDPSGGYAYFGTFTSPGRVVKVALNGDGMPVRVGALTLNSGEDLLASAVIDPSAGFAYFGTQTIPGFVVKVALNGSGVPSRTGAVTLNTGEGNLSCGVIDPSAGYAYFGTSPYADIPSTSQIIKIALNGIGNPVRVGALTPNAGVYGLAGGAIDPLAGYAFFGVYDSIVGVVKIGLNGDGIPTNAGILPLSVPQGELRFGIMDSISGYAYCPYDSNIMKVGLSPKGFLYGTKLTMPEIGAITGVLFYSHASVGNIRLSIHSDTPPRKLLWQSSSVPNTQAGGWINVPINSGTPNHLTLPPGNYWLGWQVDTSADVPSYTPGVMGDGLYIPQAFGPAPAQLDPTSPTMTSEKWSTYLSYDLPANDSLLISHTLPAKMAPNQKLLVAITMRNRGNVDWTAPTGYGLAAVNDPCNLFGAGQIPVGAGDAAAPFTNYDFLAQITAPAAEGPCLVRLQMTASGANFGPILEHTINVESPPNGTRNWDFYE